MMFKGMLPNGERYPRVGGTRGRHFAGTNLEPSILLENAATPTRRVHAVLAGSSYGLNTKLWIMSRKAVFILAQSFSSAQKVN